MDLQQLYTIAIGHHQAGRFQDAVVFYQQILQQAPHINEVRSNLGAALLGNGQSSEAEKELNSVLKSDPKSIDALLHMGQLFAGKGNESKALSYWNQAMKLAPQRADIPFSVALLFQEKNDLEKAIQWYQKAVKTDPKLVQARINLALMQLHKGNSNEARKELEYCIQQDPKQAEALLNLGHLCYDEGDIAKAEQHYRDAHAAAPGVAHTTNALARLLLEKEAVPEALDLLENQANGDTNSDILLGNAYRQSGESNKAIACYERALEKEPNNWGVRRNLAALLKEKIPSTLR